VSRYQTGKTNLDFIEARDSEWQWHQLRNQDYVAAQCAAESSSEKETPPPNYPLAEQIWTPRSLVQWSLLYIKNGISIGSSSFAELVVVTSRKIYT